MEVILLEKIENLGNLGDKINVKSGYARNYLFAKGLAVRSSKKNRALVSINHDNLHGAYRESYDVTRELLLLQLERARKFINERTTHINLFEYLKKRIEINKGTASVTEKIISLHKINI